MGNNTKKEIAGDELTGKEVMHKLGISLFEGTIIKNGEIVRESEILSSRDEIKILKMIHGG